MIFLRILLLIRRKLGSVFRKLDSVKHVKDNLHEEVSRCLCMSPFTDPKILPCFHTFCLRCLNELQRTNGKLGEITCPECGRTSKLLEVDILKTCRPIFDLTVCRMLWILKNATSLEWSPETAKKQVPNFLIALNVAPSGATIALQLITLSASIKTTECWRLRMFKIKTFKTCWSGKCFLPEERPWKRRVEVLLQGLWSRHL